MDNHNLLLPMFSPMAQPPTKRYRTIVADPPWDYKVAGIGHFSGKSAGRQYSCMTPDEILQLPIGLWAQEDARLYLWTTNSFMEQAHRIARTWGFTPRTILTWVKGRIEGGRLIQQFGLGYCYRNSTEHIVVAECGKPAVLNHDTPTALISPRHQHSEKPPAFYDMVEHVSPGPYLDVFARKQRMGWDCFGNEAYNPSELLATLTDEQADGLVPA